MSGHHHRAYSPTDSETLRKIETEKSRTTSARIEDENRDGEGETGTWVADDE